MRTANKLVLDLLGGEGGASYTGANLPFTITTTTSPQTVQIDMAQSTADMTVYWGDGSSEVISSGTDAVIPHDYATAGTYTVYFDDVSALTYFKLYQSYHGGDITSWILPDTMKELNFIGSSVTGNMSGWRLPSELVDIRFYLTGLTGDISGWVLPNTLKIMHGFNTTVSGDVSGWVFPASMAVMRIEFTSISGDISSWALGANFYQFYIYDTGVSGTPDLSANVKLKYLYMHRLSLSETNVDAILAEVYANRADFTEAAPAMNISGNDAPSGVYQDATPPTTGLEYVYKLANDPDTEGFNTWAITYEGGSAP